MKTRIMLVFPPYTREAPSTLPPIGIGYLASYILSRNPKVKLRIIDFTVNEFSVKRFKSELKTFDPEILGISVLTLNFPFSVIIARLAKECNPNIVVVMGGVHATMLPEECLEYCDVVVRGEGEEAFLEIVRGCSLDSIDGVSFYRNGEIFHNPARAPIHNLDDLPFPAYGLYEMKKYGCFPAWGVMSSRGCPFRCIFCSSPAMWGDRVRVRSARNVVDEIEYLHGAFGIKRIVFFDDTFNAPQKRAIDICDEIISRGLHRHMDFVCQMRANRQFVSPELLKKMRDANFCQVEFGIESGSQRVLNSIRKSLKVDEAKRAVKLAKEAGIPVIKGFFLIGSWNEAIVDVLRTWCFILSTPVYPVFSICTPFPGTALYKMLQEKNYIKGRLDWSVFDQVTPVSRTNQMSKACILLVYAFSSLFFELVLAFTRGRSLASTISGAIHRFRDMFRLTRLRRELARVREAERTS